MANVLYDARGGEKGERASAFYADDSPKPVYAMLACARIARALVVFGGFSPEAD